MKFEIELPEKIYTDAQKLVKERFLSDDISDWVKGLIRINLSSRCWPGYDIDRHTKCKTRNKLKLDISHKLFGTGWEDTSLYHGNFICVDIDCFNTFNDKHGMKKGNEILIAIADSLKKKFGVENV